MSKLAAADSVPILVQEFCSITSHAWISGTPVLVGMWIRMEVGQQREANVAHEVIGSLHGRTGSTSSRTNN